MHLHTAFLLFTAPAGYIWHRSQPTVGLLRRTYAKMVQVYSQFCGLNGCWRGVRLLKPCSTQPVNAQAHVSHQVGAQPGILHVVCCSLSLFPLFLFSLFLPLPPLLNLFFAFLFLTIFFLIFLPHIKPVYPLPLHFRSEKIIPRAVP